MTETTRFRGTTSYLTNEALEAAVNCALVLKKPLLVRGEPGTGKTLLAEAVAEATGAPLITWHVKSSTRAQEGLYHYDTVQRLYDSRFGDGDVRDIRQYIRLGPLGQAFKAEQRVVLLIDEVDKADLEFPNDLLHEIDRMRFKILETGDEVVATQRPIVIITSNAEKELPDAFLRRCVFHFIDFPDRDLMSRIVGVHHPELNESLGKQALDAFYAIRNMQRLRKRPSTSELVDWIAMLKTMGINTVKLEGNLPFLGTLLKKEQDMVAYADQLSGRIALAVVTEPAMSAKPRPMFINFLYRLRKHEVPVGAQEAIALAQALEVGVHDSSLDGFYYTARALMVHREAHLDAFDQAFLAEFKGVEGEHIRLKEELMEWLKDAKLKLEELSPEERKLAESLDLEQLKKLFEERMGEQKERHDRGNKWIGTAGTSPFGREGGKRDGVRLGGEGGKRSAVQVADARQYRPYRSDVTLDIRQMEMALRRLRAFIREGAEEELDLERTVDKTAKNAGEIEVATRPPSRPNTRVILMMDVGGLMDPDAQLMSQLFSAAKRASHFKELRTYYFHNCVYGRVYKTERFDDPIWIQDLLDECNKQYKVVMVGDALMAPYELLRQGGAISMNDRNSLPGIGWLMMLQQHFPQSIWLNPEPQGYWDGTTIDHVRKVYEMFPLTLEGLTQGMALLNKGKTARRSAAA